MEIRALRLRLSLFAKLSAVLLVAVIAIIWIVGFAMGEFFRQGQEHGWGHRAVGYVRFVGDTVFENPSRALIDSMAARLEVDIRYAGPFLEHATAPMPDFAELERPQGRRGEHNHWGGRHRHFPPDIFLAIRGGRLFIVHSRPPHRLAIGLGENFDQALDRVPLLAAAALAAIAAVMGAAYLLLRRMLSPLREVEGNLAAVARGEWAEEIKVKNSDEIGRVAAGFNRMQRQIRSTLEAKERLLADISHEFRTPLARMKVAVELMGEEKAKARLSEDIAQLNDLTEEILEGARLRSSRAALEKERISLASLIREVMSNYDERERKFIALDDNSERVEVDADFRLLSRTFRNLVDNSLKHSELSAGSVRIRIDIDGSDVITRISDRGAGLPRRELDKLFDSFYRADASRSRETGGYGLGMQMCKTIVEAHGGTISASSALGEGLTVSVRLPALNRGSGARSS